jgi:hypothetical protein
MINLIKIEPKEGYSLKLFFSDATFSILDFTYLIQKETVLTIPLKDKIYFQSCFIDFGALCWKNGLELSAESLYLKSKQLKILQQVQEVA